MKCVKGSVMFFALAAFGSFFAPHAMAGCTGSHPTWTSTLDSASLTTCINNAAAGDTINVGAGTQTYSSPISVTKNVSIVGAGIGVSIINGVPFSISGVTASGSNLSVRISGFTFNFPAGVGGGIYIQDAVNFRFDHDAFNSSSAANDQTCVISFSVTTDVSGLFDHVTSNYCQFEELGGDFANDNNWVNLHWSSTTPLGSASNIFFEDSTFTNPDPSANSYFNCWDSHMGGRYVIRFSTLDGCRVEGHGSQADNDRATRAWEAYNNSIVNSHGIQGYWPFSQRGGTGMIFHNTLDANWLNPVARIDSPRVNEDSIAGQLPNWQFCDGLSQSANTSGFTFTHAKTVIVDGAGTYGYRCRDQIGTGADTSTWSVAFGTPAPAQALAPVYIWKNPLGGSEMPVQVSSCETSAGPLCTSAANNIVLNRDYYTYNASFNGTNGIGEGTLATRPTTCTTGVGYWATDQGNWNQSGNGKGQGVLYQCTATNVWTVYYTPYTYPHPLQGSSGAAQVVPPTSLTATVVVR